MDVSALASMKDAAKCDTHCDLHHSANQPNSERILHLLEFQQVCSWQCLLFISSEASMPTEVAIGCEWVILSITHLKYRQVALMNENELLCLESFIATAHA